jgi:hypothetical protein
MKFSDYSSYFLKDHKDFKKTKHIISQIIEERNELPKKVFKPEYSFFLFENFDNTLSSDLWPILKNLTTNSNDSSVILSVLRPDPEAYYFKEFGYFNWCNIPIDINLTDYEKILNFEPVDSQFDTIQLNSNLIVWTSPSRKWAIWCDRSFEVSIIAFDSLETYNTLKPFVKDWLPAHNPIVKDWMEFTFENFEVPNWFSEKLISNYPSE